MNREQYIKAREENSIEIMYMYYKEFFDKKIHNPFLEFDKFVECIQLYPLVQQAFATSTAYYDAKFNILKLPLKDKILFI